VIPKRLSRVGETIRAEISDMILRDLKDPRIGLTTITGVAVSPDLRHAKIYFSILGSKEESAETLAGLTQASGYIRRELGRRLKLKFTPELHFLRDDSLETGARISELLRDIE
jgi:ribosome-binding factor A